MRWRARWLKLESPEAVGREAARRTLRRLGSRKIASTQVPIVLDPIVAESILDNIFDAVDGGSHLPAIVVPGRANWESK